jgi:hypothetical protein
LYDLVITVRVDNHHFLVGRPYVIVHCARPRPSADVRACYERALGLTQSQPEQRFLERWMGEPLD